MASSWSASAEYAGFWRRALALVIDWLVVMVVAMPVNVLAFGADFLSLDPTRRRWDVLTFALLAAAVVAFWRACGATPGKLAVGVRIVDARSGEIPGTAALILRFVCYLVSALPLYLGFAWAALDRRKQAWHDKIAGTVVIVEDDLNLPEDLRE